MGYQSRILFNKVTNCNLILQHGLVSILRVDRGELLCSAFLGDVRKVNEIACWNVLLDNWKPTRNHCFSCIEIFVTQSKIRDTSLARRSSFCVYCLLRKQTLRVLTLMRLLRSLWYLLPLLLVRICCLRLAADWRIWNRNTMEIVWVCRKRCITAAANCFLDCLLLLFSTLEALTFHANVAWQIIFLLHNLCKLSLLADQSVII